MTNGLVLHTRTIIWCMFMLTLFNSRSNTVLGIATLKDLKQVCMFEFPFDFTPNNIPPANGYCTAAGTYRSHKPKSDTDLIKIKMGLPYVYEYNISLINVENGLNVFLNPTFGLNEIKQMLEQQKPDVLILDFLDRNSSTEIPLAVDANIKSVYNQIKDLKKDLLIGLKLSKSYPNKLEVRLKDSLAPDLFVVASYEYETCIYQKRTEWLASPPNEDHLTNTVGIYQNLQFPMDKFFLTVEFVVRSWKNGDAKFYETWSYQYSCEATPGSKRRQCTQSLENIFQQVTTSRKLSLPGIFIKSIDLDDWKGSCHCGPFPAARVIKDAMNGAPRNESLLGCTDFEKNGLQLSIS